MFGFGTTEIERLFSGLTEKALEGLGPDDYRTKNLSGKDLHTAVLEASMAGIDGIISGLGKEVNRIVGGPSKDKEAKIIEAFGFGLASVRKLMGVADVKAGSASWISYATAGLDQPRKELQHPVEGWEGVFGSSGSLGTHEEKSSEASPSIEASELFWNQKDREKGGVKSSEGGELYWITKAREQAEARGVRQKGRIYSDEKRKQDEFLADAHSIVEPEEEVVSEILDLAENLWPGKSRKDLAEMIQFKGG